MYVCEYALNQVIFWRVMGRVVESNYTITSYWYIYIINHIYLYTYIPTYKYTLNIYEYRFQPCWKLSPPLLQFFFWNWIPLVCVPLFGPWEFGLNRGKTLPTYLHTFLVGTVFYPQWNFPMFFQKLEPTVRWSLLPRFREKRPTSFSFGLWKELFEIYLRWDNQ